MAICPECLVTGDHKEHKTDSIQKGYEKVVNEFKARVPEHDNLLKLSETKSTMVSHYLNTIIEEIMATKKKVKCCSQNITNQVGKKTAEAVDIIDKQVASLRKNVELLQKGKKEFKKNIENYQNDVNKINIASFEVYHKFTKNNREIRNIKVIFDKWLSSASKGDKSYTLSSTEHIYMFIGNIKECVTDFKRNISLVEPKILSTGFSILKEASDKSLLANWIIEAIGKPNFSSKLLWKETVDGFGASTFHSKCDKKGRTVTVVLSEFDHIFGGYTSKPWNSSNTYVDDPEAFIFSLTHKTNTIYELRPGVNGQTCLAGAGNFKVKEIEVYLIVV